MIELAMFQISNTVAVDDHPPWHRTNRILWPLHLLNGGLRSAEVPVPSDAWRAVANTLARFTVSVSVAVVWSRKWFRLRLLSLQWS